MGTPDSTWSAWSLNQQLQRLHTHTQSSNSTSFTRGWLSFWSAISCRPLQQAAGSAWRPNHHHNFQSVCWFTYFYKLKEFSCKTLTSRPCWKCYCAAFVLPQIVNSKVRFNSNLIKIKQSWCRLMLSVSFCTKRLCSFGWYADTFLCHNWWTRSFVFCREKTEVFHQHSADLQQNGLIFSPAAIHPHRNGGSLATWWGDLPVLHRLPGVCLQLPLSPRQWWRVARHHGNWRMPLRPPSPPPLPRGDAVLLPSPLWGWSQRLLQPSFLSLLQPWVLVADIAARSRL